VAGKSFHLEIVTPKRTVFSAEVDSFSAPGVIGSFQVLRSHAPLLSSIRVGEVKAIGLDEKELRFATSGGFVEVHHNKVVMLAETAERADEIDIDRAKLARERAQKRLSERRLETDLDRAKLSLLRSINRLKIAGRN
jgi:F-type H+-transporting ATPase subunit epsilon